MEKIFFIRGKGRVKRMLTVYSDGVQYRLHYLVLDRTSPSRADKAQGIREKRFETLNQERYIRCDEVIDLDVSPLPDLTRQFVIFLSDKKHHHPQ
ncbi:hypothetical protein [Enterobacter asburiae]|uniref:hypothetical protein n=1 Tax=Enterobacter asburiae TaxID=61645 RepID=UPI003F57C940